MARYISQSQSLETKYAVGEIADFISVPDYYDAGLSKWMKSNTWIAGSLLPTGFAEQLRQSDPTLIALTDNIFFNESYASITGGLPAAVVGTTRCIAYKSYNKYQTAYCLTITASDIRIISIGQTTSTSLNQSNGGAHVITSDGTTFWSWNIYGGLLTAYSSTDGITWTQRTLSGVISGMSSTYPLGMQGTQNSYERLGDMFFTNQQSHLQTIVWCGARHLMIGQLNGGSVYVAMRSSDGTTWGGDETTTILGGASISSNAYAWYYRNGNSFFIALSNVSRYSADGGITWAASTNGPFNAYVFRVNATDPARLAGISIDNVYISFSSNSGQSWTARTAPVVASSSASSFCGRGAIWMLAHLTTGSLYKTTDDGATWDLVQTPSGMKGNISQVFADSNRWYLYSRTANQIAVSTDGTNWTIRNIRNMPTSSIELMTMVATDSDHVIGVGANSLCLNTVDGGVTWQWATISSTAGATGGATRNIVANTTGTPCFLSFGTITSDNSTSLLIQESDLDTGGKYVRASSATISPIRSNSFAYVRVA